MWRLRIYNPGEVDRTELVEDEGTAHRMAKDLVESDEATFVEVFPPELALPTPIELALKNRILKAHGKAPLPIGRGASRRGRR